MSSFISAAPVASGQMQSLDGLRGHSLPSDAMIYASANQVLPANQNPGSYAIVESAGATPTINGSVPATTLSPFADVYKEGSMYFPGVNTSNISVTLGSSYNWGQGLTAEAWVYYTSFAGSTIVPGSTVSAPCALGAFAPSIGNSTAWSLGADTNGKLLFYYYGYTGGTFQSANTNISLSLNTWNHVAVSVPSGGPGSLYINGVQQSSNTNVNGSVSAASAVTFALNGSPFNTYNYLGLGSFNTAFTTGYIADARVTYGAALYTGSSFTVPSAPLGIAGSGTTVALIRAGQNSPTIQNGALTFDRGLKQYMDFGPQTLNLATRGFTAVFRWTATGSVQQYERIFEFGNGTISGSATTGSIGAWVDTGIVYFSIQNGSTTSSYLASTPTLTRGTTYILTFLYNSVSAQSTVYVNGVPGTPVAVTNATDRTLATVRIGGDVTGANASYGPNGSRCASATMNCVAVYNRALSNVEILNSYLALTTVPATPLQKTLEIGDINGVPALSVAGDGRVQVQRIGLSSNVVPWPPAAMTGYVTSINGGAYVASGSGELTTGYPAWGAFDRSSLYYATSFSGYATTAPYNYSAGTYSTVDIQGTVYPGEWLQIQLPSAIALSSYSITPNLISKAPARFSILGSRDGVNWSLVDSRSNQTSWSVQVAVLYSLSSVSTQSFNFFRIVIGSIAGPILNGQYGIEIYEMLYYGTADTSPALTIAPATTFNTSVATPSLTGIAAAGVYAPQDFSSSGLNIPAYVVSNTATVANTVAFSSFGPFAGEGSFQFPGGSGAYVNFGTAVNGLWPGGGALTDGTIEMWVYLAKYNTNNTILLIREGNLGVSTLDWYFYITPAGVLSFVLSTSVTNYSASGGTVPLNTWSHVAFTMKAGFMTVFLNGVAGGTTTTATGTVVNTSSESLVIGNYQTSAGFTINGYISNMRLTTGQALYTTTFTPPTGPLQPIQGTTQAGLPYGTVLLLRNAPAPGRIQTTKFSGANSSSVLAFPPAAMTGYSTTLNSGYGQGTYVASASSELNSTNQSWYAFDQNSGTLWGSFGTVSTPYSVSTGIYAGSNVTVDVTGSSYSGEWVQIQMPSSIVLSSYSIQSRSDSGAASSPSTWVILGSRDGVNWFLVDRRGNITWSTSQTQTFSTNSAQAFTYFRCSTQIIQTGSSQTIVTIAQWTLNGTIESVNVTADGRVGLGVVAPVQALEVAGNMIVSGTVSSQSTMFRNVLINGDMRINQRGISTTVASPSAMGTTTSAYTLDRWLCYRGTFATNGTVAQGTMTSVDLPYQNDGLVNFMRIGRTVGDTSVQAFNIVNSLETKDSIRLAGKFVTMSFYYRMGAAFAGSLAWGIGAGPGTDQNYAAGWTAGGLQQSGILPVTTAWTKSSFSAQIPINLTQVAAFFYYVPTTATAVANDYFDVTGVQLEKGSVATPFEVRPYATELALCQRYWEQSYALGTAAGTNTAVGLVQLYGSSDSNGSIVATQRYQVAKRITVTPTIYTSTGTAGSWNYARSGASGNGAINDNSFSTVFGYNFYIAVGAAWVPCFIQGHWVANAEL